jgi:hypothetical protein
MVGSLGYTRHCSGLPYLTAKQKTMHLPTGLIVFNNTDKRAMLYAVLLFGISENLCSEFEVGRCEMKYGVPTNITVGNAAPYD